MLVARTQISIVGTVFSAVLVRRSLLTLLVVSAALN